MEATLKPSSIKVFTKALTCLSKFGEELSLAANRDGLVLSTVNSSKSAYARFSFPRDFFQSYQLTTGTAQNSQGFSQTQRVDREPKGELLVKVLLSVFKSKTIEKLVERVELKLHDGPTESQEAEQDELESKLIVRLCCKQGITKTHLLRLNVSDLFVGPRMPDPGTESKVLISNDVIKEVLEHFSRAGATGGKGKDPKLTWEFSESRVTIKTVDPGHGVEYLATELAIEADQFEAYEVNDLPMAFAWQLREFNASVASAVNPDSPIGLTFTNPGGPLFIEVDTNAGEEDHYETFFVIATEDRSKGGTVPSNGTERLSKRKSSSQVNAKANGRGLMLPPLPPQTAGGSLPSQNTSAKQSQNKEPLFIPGTQLTQEEQSILRHTGLGDGDFGDFEAMMQDEGEEVEFQPSQNQVAGSQQGRDEEGSETESDYMEPSQVRPAHAGFRPLFDD